MKCKNCGCEEIKRIGPYKIYNREYHLYECIECKITGNDNDFK